MSAVKLCELSGVPIVLLGHNHKVDVLEINTKNGPAIYANAGTWTSVSNPWSRIMRDARRLTFLLLKDKNVELKRWNDDALRFDDVPLFRLEDQRERREQTVGAMSDSEHSWLASSNMNLEEDDDEKYPVDEIQEEE